MKITVLTENTSKKPVFEAEHGLSLYIETQNHKILFDMGQSDLFIKNAEKLGIFLEDVDIAVLSHGHYDHGGGLAAFLDINCKARVFVSRHAFEPHYNGSDKYIGLDEKLKDHPRLTFTGDVFCIDEELCLYTCNDRPKKYSFGSAGLNTMAKGKLTPDDFRHEQYLLISENGKDALISGCSHKGIMDIAAWFKPQVLVGGFHFSKLPLDETLRSYASTLAEYDTEFYTCHCTGTEQYKFMKKQMKNLHYISTAETIVV